MWRLFCVFLLCCSGPLLAAPALTLKSARQTVTYELATLQGQSGLRAITIPNDVAYNRSMQYQALPLAPLLRQAGFQPGDQLRLVALDGFAMTADAAPFLNEQGAQAWLAVENPQAPWPPLRPGKPGAGPLYVVWTHPEQGKVTAEMWPYQLAMIDRVAPLEERFPMLLPDAALPQQGAVWQGFAHFKQHCLACHSLNQGGDARLGPDLNVPYNPTEYLGERFLRQLIRDPKSLRWWEKGQMPALSAQSLSDAQLGELLQYLQHMAGRKVTP